MRLAPALLLLSALAFACYITVIPIDGNYTLYLQGPRYAEWNGSLLVYKGGGLAAVLQGSGFGVLWGNGTYVLAGRGELGLLVCSGLAAPSAGGPRPLGVVDYGVADLWGAEVFFVQRAEAAVGCFNLSSPLVISSGPLGEAPAYSIQLNAYVEVGGRLYWAQALARYFNGSFNFLDNLWNFTGPVSTLHGVVGNGVVAYYGRDMYYYYEQGLAPLSSACLTISVKSTSSGAEVLFYLNDTLMDEVRIPDAGEPRIVVEPGYSPRGLPIDLELVVGGYGSSYPEARLLGGNISLMLYLVNNGVAEPPPAAWSAGASTKESIHASATPAGRGAVVEVGKPLQAQLYADFCIYFLNGTVDCGGVRRYLVLLMLPYGSKAFWAAPGALNISPPIIYAGRIRYVPTQTISIEVDGPVEITPSYVAQYKVAVEGLGRSWSLWVDAGSALNTSALVFILGGVRYEPAQRLIVVDAPMNISLAYTAIYSGRALDYFGIPDPLSIAVLNCGEAQAVAVAGPLGYFNASLLTNVMCSARLYKSPISLYAIVAVALALYLAKLFRGRNIY